MKNYYEVIAKCGHVGKRNYVPIKFAVKTESGKEAAAIVRQYPRVKHHHKDAILSVKKIDYGRYSEIREANKNDPYLKCHSRHEQELIEGLKFRLETDLHGEKQAIDEKARRNRVVFKMKKLKSVAKSLMKEYNYYYDYSC
ncbi:MAG: hypothetical protein IJ706_02885 [Clostridia bacterium]|nr:hypothetical protein [Clostridia bacterium]